MMTFYQRLKQSLNQRTLYALILLGCLLGFALIGRIGDAVASAAETHRLADERLARHGGVVDEDAWRTRAENAETVLAQWQSTQWSGPTAGFIAAEMQSRIRAIAVSAGLRVISINVEQAPVDTPEGPVLQFSMATESHNGDGVANALAMFAAHEPMLFIDGVNAVFDENKRGRFSINGFAPVSITTPSEENS